MDEVENWIGYLLLKTNAVPLGGMRVWSDKKLSEHTKILAYGAQFFTAVCLEHLAHERREN